MKTVYDRRKFIGKYLFLSSVIVNAVAILSGCDSKEDSQGRKDKSITPNSCEDFSGVSENDIKVRTKLGYVEKSPLPSNSCSNCNLHIPPAPGKECGGCMLFKGPVYLSGYCTYWAPLLPPA